MEFSDNPVQTFIHSCVTVQLLAILLCMPGMCGYPPPHTGDNMRVYASQMKRTEA